MRTRRGLIAILLPLAALGARADTGEVAALGSGDGEIGCVVVGVGAGAGRVRGFAAFYPDAAALTPAGGCPEDQPHVEPPVVCVRAEAVEGGTALYLAASGGGSTYLFRVVDGGPQGPDALGVAEGEETEDRCGAADVPVTPVARGAFSILAAP